MANQRYQDLFLNNDVTAVAPVAWKSADSAICPASGQPAVLPLHRT
jgi:hypothetical protein